MDLSSIITTIILQERCMHVITFQAPENNEKYEVLFITCQLRPPAGIFCQPFLGSQTKNLFSPVLLFSLLSIHIFLNIGLHAMIFKNILKNRTSLREASNMFPLKHFFAYFLFPYFIKNIMH